MQWWQFCSKMSYRYSKAVCIDVPSTCIAATLAGAINNTLGFFITTAPYDKVFVSGWYMTFIKKDLPHPAFPVKNTCSGFFQKCVGLVISFLKHFLPNYEQYQTVDAASD